MTEPRSVLITGCSSGFGRELCRVFLDRGWRVHATLRRLDERRPELEAELAPASEPDRRARLVFHELDVTSAEQLAAAVAALGDEGLDGLVNNAGYGLWGALEDISEDQLRRQFDVNVLGAAAVTRAFLPALRARRGALVFISSVMGRAGWPLASGYCSSKWALEGLAESLWQELRPLGVRVHLVEPGGHRTNFATNIDWAEGDSATYRARTEAFKAFLGRTLAGSGVPPRAVVRRTERLLVKRSSRLRHQVGSDAFMLSLLGLLPDALRLRVLGAMLRRMLFQGAT